MPTILRLDCSPSGEASFSRRLGDEAVALLLATHPGAAVVRRNLADSPQYQEVFQRYRQTLRAWMTRMGDPLLAAFDHRDDRQVVDAAIDKYTPASRMGRKPKRSKPDR